jgi:glycosyltransferase involved in cell wall biosynthesis
MAAANHTHLAALAAHLLAGRPCPLVLRASNHLGGGRGLWFDRVKRASVGLYRLADCVVAVSADIADQLRTLAPNAAIRLLPNPVVDASFAGRMAQPPPHPWLGGPVPVVVGMGRLEKQKDFPTLIRAVRRLGNTRLVILGEGSQRARLEDLGQGMEMLLPGFVEDPLPWLAHASAFALSSAWEGMPGALIEAMACGCPVVSTRCPGASEVVLDGRLGPLVPVGDDEALAAALRRVLATPPDRARLMRRAQAFAVEASAQAYRDLFTALSAARET